MKFGVNWKSLIGILVLLAAQSTFAYRVITDRIPLGKGVVYSFVEYNKRKVPTAIGVAISGSAIKTLPEEMGMFDLVPEGMHKIPPYDHIGFDWNPMGHEPPGIYDLPHFDFHFYTIPQGIRHAITCQGADEANCLKPVASSYVPIDYVPTPAGVPMMGWHWLDSKSAELNGQKFTRTFIYGYYKGVTAFLEPMVTVAYLKSKPQMVFPVKQQQNITISGWYPKNYSVSYKAVTDTYEVALIDLYSRTSSR